MLRKIFFFEKHVARSTSSSEAEAHAGSGVLASVAQLRGGMVSGNGVVVIGS